MAEPLILIVEDNENNKKLLRDVLRHRGYRVAEAASAEEGNALAAAQLPALILMDIQLPAMSGIEALALLRADTRTRHIPVVAVTASAMDQDRARIMAAGFNAYQRKPISVKELLLTVEALLPRPGDAAGA
ncbi:MAG TPA: response regulator [Burkholderiales bacterium]|jgi:CheY-like chemotaxis protein|nr:response regulator [Burkholderiales bacterium]